MPQTFQVLRCYKCEVFQVHPTKKDRKWACKLCNEKQSIKRFYCLGTGKQCRLHVQKLNGIRGDSDASGCGSVASDHSSLESPEHSGQDETCSAPKKSKWLDYVDPEENLDENSQISDEIMHLHNTEVVLELPPKCPKKTVSVSTKTIPNKPKTEYLTPYNSQTPKSYENKRSNAMKPFDKNQLNGNPCMTNATNNIPACQVKNSKWAKFVENPVTSKDENGMGLITDTNSESSLNPTFPFTEEEDLDSVLDI